ncbi:MAG TPA: TolC family protein [Polyangiaceae bacterium]|nr:TolC family protein [Polyangiaceae bacterium]
MAQAPLPAPANPPIPSAAPNASEQALATPNLPDVSDPMLTPVEAPKQVVRSWREALALVRSRSTSIATARARVAQANAQGRQVLAADLPTIAANASVRRDLLFGNSAQFQPVFGQQPLQRSPYPATVWSADVSLRQALLDLRSWHDVGTAKLAVAAAATSARDSERLALGTLADAIVTVITAERLAEVSRVSLRSNLSTLDLTKRRAALGAASAVDVLRAAQEVATTRADVVQADETLRQAREALGLALGFPESWGVAADIKVDELSSDARAVCSPLQSAEQRSDVVAASQNVEVNQRNVTSVDFAHAPILDVVSDLAYTSQPQAARPLSWSIGAVLTVPIYDGGLLSAQRDINRATLEVARQQLTDSSRRAQLQVIQAQRSVEVAEANFGVSRQARDIAADSARLSRIAFVHGTGTSFDLVDSASRLRLAEIDLTIKEFEVVKARLEALLALANCDI